jgi:hypothetical protein
MTAAVAILVVAYAAARLLLETEPLPPCETDIEDNT